MQNLIPRKWFPHSFGQLDVVIGALRRSVLVLILIFPVWIEPAHASSEIYQEEKIKNSASQQEINNFLNKILGDFSWSAYKASKFLEINGYSCNELIYKKSYSCIKTFCEKEINLKSIYFMLKRRVKADEIGFAAIKDEHIDCPGTSEDIREYQKMISNGK